MSSTYRDKDREFQLQCAFLEDGLNRPIYRQNCNVSSASNGLQELNLSCPTGTFPSGLQSKKLAADRTFQFYCCELATVEGKKLRVPKIDAGDGLGPQTACDTPMVGLQAQLQWLDPNLQVNAVKDPLAFTCPMDARKNETNKVLTGFFQTEYSPDEQDRRWGFSCCFVGFSDITLPTQTEP
jgi:hypothetical protein